MYCVKTICIVGLLDVEHVTKFQLESDILIVLRPVFNKTTEYYSKYAASAKIIEYLLSGNTVITNNVPCLSEELKKYLLIMKDCNEQTIVNTILGCKKKNNINKEQQKFAIENYNEKILNEKICDFIDEIVKSDRK